MEKVELKDFCVLFGGTVKEVETFCGELISKFSWEYKTLTGQERDQLLLNVLQRVNSPELKSSGAHRSQDWEDGWSENLEEFTASGFDIAKLVPKYFKQNVPVRLLNNYVLPSDPDFVLNITCLFRSFIFNKYLSEFNEIHEFGCGTGHHLACFASVAPKKKYVGYDWASSSQRILQLLAKQKGWSITGKRFDFLTPDPKITFMPETAVMTFGALEQLGREHEQYLDFILQRKPKICIDIAGIAELYDKDVLLDYMALQYHKCRNYLDGYLTRLKELEMEGKIQILKVHRQKFGNLYDDPHSYVVWKAIK